LTFQKVVFLFGLQVMKSIFFYHSLLLFFIFFLAFQPDLLQYFQGLGSPL